MLCCPKCGEFCRGYDLEAVCPQHGSVRPVEPALRPEHLESRLEALEARCKAIEDREGSRDIQPPSVHPAASQGPSCNLDFLETLAARLENGGLSDYGQGVAARHLRAAIAEIEGLRLGSTRPGSPAMAKPRPGPTGCDGVP